MQIKGMDIFWIHTYNLDPSFLSCHNQGSAPWLVNLIHRCIMGQEQLNTVYMASECSCMERCPDKQRQQFLIDFFTDSYKSNANDEHEKKNY